MLDNFVTTTEAATAAKLPYRTLDSWMRQGDIGFTKLGNYRLVKLSDVLAVKAAKDAKKRSA